MQQSVLNKAVEEKRPEFTDEEISAVLRRTDVRTDGATLEERRVAAINVLRFERMKNEELAMNDRGKQEDLRAAWLKSGTSSWYDAGVRPISEGSAQLPVEVDLEPIEKIGKEKLSTSAQASLAVGLLGALAVIGIDIGSVGIVENLDAAVLVGGLAVSQMDDEGPVGTTLRAIGNATSEVFEFSSDVASPVAKWASEVYVEKEVGYTGRALLEMGLEQVLGAANPKRREAERLSTEYETAATVAAELRGQRDALPVWELQARWSLDAEVRDAESTANTAKRAARAAYAALEDE
jgi:hypothetical protein|tara:strand:+ start:766 stop:1647 length:882 start_codon:yes stop_codon:yes gene_type:complete